MITRVNQDFDSHENNKRDHEYRCCCGSSFKLLRGLNSHRKKRLNRRKRRVYKRGGRDYGSCYK